MERPSHPLFLNFPATFLLFVVLTVGIPISAAYADPIARSIGTISTVDGGGIARGPGAVCARSEVTGNADPAAANPAAKGCNDTTLIGPVGGLEPIVGNQSTGINGNREQFVFRTRAGGVAGGRALLYNETDVADKVASAAAAPDSTLVLMRTAAAVSLPRAGFANATQTVVANPFVARGNKVSSSAAAQVAGGAGFSIAIVNDPVDIDLFDPAIPGSASVRIGDGASLLSLDVDGPGEFALALFEFGRGIPGSSTAITVVSFEVDSAAQSLADVITVLQFDVSSGFASAAALEAYLESPLNDFFSFDPIAHRLTQNREAPLMQIDLAAGSSPVHVVFNTEAIAGTVPVSSTLALVLIG